MFIFALIAFVILLSLGCLCSMSETALFSLTSSQVAREEKRHLKGKQIAEILRRPRQLLVTLLLLNIMVNVLVQNVASEIFSQSQSWLLQVGLPLVLTLMFSELLPKVVAMSLNLKIARLALPFVRFCLWFLSPFHKGVSTLSTIAAAVLFFFVKSPPPLSSRQLLQALNSKEEEGGRWLSEDESSLLQGLVELQEAKVRDLMWPRDDIVFFDIEDSIEKLYTLFKKEECSKLPVCRGNLDNILGILYAQDFIALNAQNLKLELIYPLLKQPFFVPETSRALDLLNKFERHHRDLSIVVNEYGVISGILTSEDLLEAVVGEIRDQRDHKYLLNVLSDGGIVASGKVELEELQELLHQKLPTSNMSTLGGLLNELHGDIPQSGEIIRWNNFEFRVLTARPQRVLKVFIHVDKHSKEEVA